MKGHGLLRLASLLAIFAFAGDAGAAEPADENVVRLAVVNTPQFSGLLDSLLPDFERQTGIMVDVYSGSDVYRKARSGQADLVISHYGKKGVERFDSERASSELEILVAEDPSLQRIMAAIVVKPDKVPGVNADGARALVDYLLSPRVQAKIAAFRIPGSDLQLWWPAGRNN